MVTLTKKLNKKQNNIKNLSKRSGKMGVQFKEPHIIILEI